MKPNNFVLKKHVSQFREQNGISSSEAIRLKSLLLKLNVITIFKPLPSKFSGMAVKTDSFKFMLINNNLSLGKQHFTIAHELYHLFIQEDFSSMICNVGLFNSRDYNEFQADQFASQLLMPDEGIFSLVPDNELQRNKIQLSTIVKIEQFYSVSRTALLIRLKGLDLLSEDRIESFRLNITKSALQLGYPRDLYSEGNKGLIIGDYGERAKRLFDNEIISETNYVSLMNDIGVDVESDEEFINDQENN